MLYLAQVKEKLPSGEVELQLIAHQDNDMTWIRHRGELHIKTTKTIIANKDVFLLIKLDDNQEVSHHENVKEWLIDVIEKYLSNPLLSHDFIAKEEEKIETWRQEIVSQSQELSRKQLELETRREQIQQQLQQLEDKLKEKDSKIKELEIIVDQLQQNNDE